MKQFLNRIRTPAPPQALSMQVIYSLCMALWGVGLGVFQKWLDSGAYNRFPELIQSLDIHNFFGRFAIWILLGTVISVYSRSPFRASINTFLFLICMVIGYYTYCRFVLGFFSRSYMMIWVMFSILSILPAWICWYARGSGLIAILISAFILGILFSQGILIVQGIFIKNGLEVLIWFVGLFVLRRKGKEFFLELVLSFCVAILYQILFYLI